MTSLTPGKETPISVQVKESVKVFNHVAVETINGTTRTNDDKPNQPLDTLFNQKINKYGQAADQNQLRFIPVIVSYAGEMHKGIINLLLEQIRLKLQLVDG